MTLQIEQLGDVIRLRMSSPGSRLAGLDVSAYVVRGILVDTGFHRARHELDEALTSLAVRGAILTHWHEDHAGNAELLAARGIPLSIRADTEAILRRRPPIRLYRRAVWGHPPPLRSRVEPLALGELEVVHTPGHTEDHQVVWDPRTETVFAGDLWLGVRARAMHEHEDPYAIVRSLRAVAALSPRRMFDAHRGSVERPGDALTARADWLTETTDEIARRIAQGWTDGQILRRVLGGEERAGYASGGEYARRNLVRAVRRTQSS